MKTRNMANPFKRDKLIALGIATALAFGTLNGCVTHAQTPAREHQIEITGFLFVPETIDAKPGDTITWINRDIVPHTATGSDASWDTGTINKDESKSIVLSSEMDSSYLCRFHPSMKGSVVETSD